MNQIVFNRTRTHSHIGFFLTVWKYRQHTKISSLFWFVLPWNLDTGYQNILLRLLHSLIAVYLV